MSSGLQEINLCHINDICYALLCCSDLTLDIKPNTKPKIYAALAKQQITIRNLVATIEQIVQSKLPIEFGTIPDGPTAKPLWLTAPSPIGWSPQTSLNSGLEAYFSPTDNNPSTSW